MGFVEQARRVLASLAVSGPEGGRGDDERLVPLAAHLFAVCAYLKESLGSGALDARRPRACAGADEARALVAALAGDEPLDAAELHARLLAALLGLDHQLHDAVRDDAWLPAAVTLEPIPDEAGGPGPGPGVTGVVLVARRCPGRWRVIRKLRDEDPARRNTVFAAAQPARQLVNLSLLWQRGDLPAVELGRLDRPHEPLLTDGDGGRAGDAPWAFPVALCPLAGAFGPRFRVSEDGRTFTVDRERGMDGGEALARHLAALLGDLGAAGVQLAVLPELSVDLAGARAPAAAAAGAGGGPRRDRGGELPRVARGPPSPANEAVLLGRHGAPLLVHDKRGAFHLHRAEALGPRFVVPPAELPEEIYEGIERGRRLHLLETPLGRLGVVICSDAVDPTLGYREAIKRAGVDLLVIVAMSARTADFYSFAEELARCAAATLFVNAASLVATRPGELLAFAHLGLWEPRGAAPTRVRWRAGVGGPEPPEYFDQARASRGDGRDGPWRPVDELQVPAGAFLLPKGASSSWTWGCMPRPKQKAKRGGDCNPRAKAAY